MRLRRRTRMRAWLSVLSPDVHRSRILPVDGAHARLLLGEERTLCLVSRASRQFDRKHASLAGQIAHTHEAAVRFDPPLADRKPEAETRSIGVQLPKRAEEQVQRGRDHSMSGRFFWGCNAIA